MSTPQSMMNNGAFFPTTQATPDHASANAMLAARKQQLAHLQTLQRQQQQVLQQMSVRGNMNVNASAAGMQGNGAGMMVPSSPMGMGGYAMTTTADGRDDRFSAGGMRSHPGSPNAASSVVSFQRGTSQAGVSSVSSPRIANNSGRPAFECDYDTNPTELYLSVQRKDWDGAVERAATCPHEASTWVSRKEADGKLRWRLLPLHAAIIFRAPERTISALLFAFAQGAACKDDQGMLPLHLAFRNGCDEEVIHLLLMAYPQSVDVQDRKGRTPMVLAQQSNHANRELYIRALERGPAYYAVANAAKDGIVSSPGFVNNAPASPSMAQYQHQQQYQHQPVMPPTMPAAAPALPVLTNEAVSALASTAPDGERISDLEAELAKTQETSQVLVDHVNSLEAQLASRSDTERFLATKIANLDSQLKDTNARLEEANSLTEAKERELETKDAMGNERTQAAEEEVKRLEAALADKKEAELKSYKLTNKERFDLEERVETSERDCAAAQANAAVLEAQLKKKIETEQSLASQVSMLASQLASSASSSSEANSAYQRKCESLSAENKKLQTHIVELEGKLGTVATALDAMAAEQERIVDAATSHEKSMAACAKAHQAIINDTTRQEMLLEDAAKEREQIVSILMRQAEDAERTMADREKVLEAVKTQEEDIMMAAQERDAVVDSVNKQREYMDFMLNGELKFLKRTDSEDEHDLVKEQKLAMMEEAKDQYLAENPLAAPVSPVAVEESAADEIMASPPTSPLATAEEIAAAAFAPREEPAEIAEPVAEEPTSPEEAASVVEEPTSPKEAASVVEEPSSPPSSPKSAAAVEVEDDAEDDNAQESDDEEEESDDEEDAALAEAAEAVKAAMRAAQASVGVDDNEDDDDSDDDEEEDDEEDANSHIGEVSDAEEEESPVAEADADVGYETPASREEEEAIDAAISAVDSDDDSDSEDRPQEAKN